MGGEAHPSSGRVPGAPGAPAALPLSRLPAGHLQGVHVAWQPPRTRERGRGERRCQGYTTAASGAQEGQEFAQLTVDRVQ